MNTFKSIKQVFRSILGDKFASWIHAGFFWWYLEHGKSDEVDMFLAPTFIKKGDVAIDIGANGADWTLALSRQVGEEGHVFAFEADPYYAEVTKKTIKLLRLGNVTFFPFGLSDRRETTILKVRDDSGKRVSGKGRVVRQPEPDITDKKGYLKIELETLDAIANRHPMVAKVNFIKCDVEGFELMVFKGALSVLIGARPIVIVEVGSAYLHGYAETEIFDFFKQLDYRCYVAVSEKLLRKSENVGRIPEGYRPNRIMIPKELTSDGMLNVSIID